MDTNAIDARIKQLSAYLQKMSLAKGGPIGGKPILMGEPHMLGMPQNAKASSGAYDHLMNLAESELQDLLKRKNALYSSDPYMSYGPKY